MDLLAEDFTYESQMVFSALRSKQAFLHYIRAKSETTEREKSTVYAEMGMVATPLRKRRPCVVLAQYDKTNLVGLVLAAVKDNKLHHVDICIVPPPQFAERSGEYPA